MALILEALQGANPVCNPPVSVSAARGFYFVWGSLFLLLRWGFRRLVIPAAVSLSNATICRAGQRNGDKALTLPPDVRASSQPFHSRSCQRDPANQ